MTPSFRVPLGALCALLLLAPPVVGVHAQQPALSLTEARQALDALEVERAAPALEALARSHPDDPSVMYELGRLRLHQGRYADAVEALSGDMRGSTPRQTAARAELLALARATRDATADFVEARSEDGRYVVRYPPGESALLAPYALETLRRADEALTREIGGHAPRPLRLEIYTSPRDLARVSPLTVEAIETSGTIALSKWDRLMLTSPRALVRGYPWRDTVAHELAHLLLTRATRDQAPVWLQEGTAKLLEASWREPISGSPLGPEARGLLHDALAQGTLIPFSRLHPSLALLPSQQETALAFAEVASFMSVVRHRAGAGGLRALAAALGRGVEAREAVGAAVGSSFAALERSWHEQLQTARPDAVRSPFRPLRFRHRGEDESSEEVADGEARRRVRLGDLLSEAGHAAAATVEYEAAAAAAPDDPAIAWRLARAALASGDPNRAVEVLAPLRERAPDYEPVRAWLARALSARGDDDDACIEANRAIGLNPFDPLPHCVLSQSAPEPAEREREADSCRRLH